MTLELLAKQYPIVAQLMQRNEDLEVEVKWFRDQIFGTKSEKRVADHDPKQMALGEMLSSDTPAISKTKTVKQHERRDKQKDTDGEPDSLLRFDDSVPVKVVEILPEGINDLPEDSYELITTKTTHQLAQLPGSYVVLQIERKVIKLKETQEILCAPVPDTVLDRSFAHVSLLVGILIDKFLYHLPLYRQHQRLAAAGVTISRVTLTNYVHRTVALLQGIYQAQLISILESNILQMDETSIKAGQSAKRGKMQKGYYWPIYGDREEVAFPFAPSRAERVAREVLGQYCGTLVTDGYKVYEKVVGAQDQIRHAQCWVHARRMFIKAKDLEPELVDTALDLIGQLYKIEEEASKLKQVNKRLMRLERSKLIVDKYFNWLNDELDSRVLLPSNKFTAAANYSLQREKALRVFLEDPDVPLDTNQIERALRPIPMGRKNWLFCWTEVGAEYVGQIQSLLITCKLQGIDPYTYLVDVLQRINTHPASEVYLLTPRLWKQHFAKDPMRSCIDRIASDVVQ